MNSLPSDTVADELRDLKHLLGWCFARARHGVSSFKTSERMAALSDITYHTERFRDAYDPQRKLKVTKNTMWMGESP